MRPTALLVACLLLTACQHPVSKQVHSHQVVYAVTGPAGTSTQTVDVQRPYRGRIIDTVNGEVQSNLAWSESGTFLTVNGAVRQSAVGAPGFPGPAAHLEVALPVALRQGLVQDLGTTRTVAGNGCHEWRSKLPLDGAAFSLPTKEAVTTSCVNARGEVLADRWEQGGQLLRQRTATSVSDAGPSLLGTDLFLGRDPVPVPSFQSTYSVTRSDAVTLTKALQIPVPAVPDGLALDRAAALLEVSRDGSAVAREAAVLTYASADHLVVLKLGRDLLPGIAEAVHGEQVLVGLRTGTLQPVLHGLKLRLVGPRGLVATVTSDVPEQELLRWASGLSLGT